jgi:PAS domain-containing protein
MLRSRRGGAVSAVFENSAIGVALTDLDGRFLAANRANQKMLGYAAENSNLSWGLSDPKSDVLLNFAIESLIIIARDRPGVRR